MLPQNFIPKLPFDNFKWKWASLQCTEGLNDPVVLLGVLFRMRKLEALGLKYSSPEFSQELKELSTDIKDSIGIDLSNRSGERNLIRNSGQYWRAVGLLETGDHTGKIKLTDFGRRVADHDISQTEFAAITIQTFKLPNIQIQSPEECKSWIENELVVYPLKLILTILDGLNDIEQGYITPEELIKIIIPLSACKAEIADYINFILWYRTGDISLIGWPDCAQGANDARIAREFLLFLFYYGYITIEGEGRSRFKEKCIFNSALENEIKSIIAEPVQENALIEIVDNIRISNVASEIERKRVETQKTRPNQAKFRKEVLRACERCIITNVTMPEVLEAAHIKPFKYNGEDIAANGFAMRMDIHLLFDTGHLRISDVGDVSLSTRARMDYGALIPPRIVIPQYVNIDNIKWRWDNYNGL